MPPKPPNHEATQHHKRAGIFYGSPEGHPIIWNNDWNSLIQKEILQRDTFSRKYLAGKIAAQPPSFVNKRQGESGEWRSTYADLGEWGGKTFRKFVPHKVSKTDVELPSVPPTGRTDLMSEYAFRHANFQLGKTMPEPYVSTSKHTVPNAAPGPDATGLRRTEHAKPPKIPSTTKPLSKEERVQMKQFLAMTLLSTAQSPLEQAKVKEALRRSLQNDDSAQRKASSQSRGMGISRAQTSMSGEGRERSESALWRSVYEDLGSWGPKTQQRSRPKIVTRIDVEGIAKDINRPVYPGSPKPHTGAKRWVTDYKGIGNWGPDTFRKWIPPKVLKRDVETDPNVSDLSLLDGLKTPKYMFKDNTKTSSLEGPRTVW